MKRMLTNPFEAKPRPWKRWHGYVFGVVALACVGLYVFQWLNGGPLLPTAGNPVERYNALLQENPTIKAINEQRKAAVVAEPVVQPAPEEAPSNSPITGGGPLTEVAKKALETMNAPTSP